MKKYLFKVCTILLAAMMMAACGDKAQNSGDGTRTESKAASKSGTARNAKKKNNDIRTAGGKSRKSILTPTSAGAPYEILVVGGDDDFNTGAVDTLYSILTSDVPGILQSEPRFKVSKIHQQGLSKTLRLCRNIVVIKINPSMYSTCKINFSRDVYAAPQIIMTIQAPSALKFKTFVTDNRDEITEFFTRAELNRQIDILREDHQPNFQEEIKKMFGCDMWVPGELTDVYKGRNFLWARSERFVKKVEQELNIVVYSYPYRDVNTFTDAYFTHKRDSVLAKYIPGPNDGQYMVTTKGFNLISDETVHGKYAQVVRGLWNVKNYDMGGSFVSVSRVDEKYQRVIVAEAFVYYPNHPKRDPLKKLEAALYTLHLPDELNSTRSSFKLEEIVITPED